MHKRLLIVILLMLAVFTTSAQDSATAVASHRYECMSIGDKIFMGNNYRRLWAMPVAAKVFHLNTERGGFIIKGPGGGMQTRSLHLEDKEGNKWVLRGIDKTVDRAMDAEGIKNKRVRRFSQKMLSASQPYGSLTLPPMARSLGVTSTEPQLYFIPDDPAFGEYRSTFANTLCLLEKREPVVHEGDKVEDPEDLVKDLQDKSYHVDEKMLLQARLLDMVVGDWDRHYDQWKWEYHKEYDGETIIYPIPRDHDQAYFNSTGLFVNIVRTFNMHMFVGFRRRLKLKALNYKAWHLDRTLLKDLSEDDWRNGIRTFQSTLTDDVIKEGLHRLPPAVYDACGPRIDSLLRIRRDKLLNAGIAYYRFLQRHPNKIAKEARKEGIKAEKAEELKRELKETR